MDDEIQINGGESLGENFYEKIEAPKFVDLAKPDHYHPDNDDSYWFCLRVGCDQRHEKEMDSEAIYKNFVLRVLAARSPNVRLQKVLYGKDSSTNMKCPLTVPAKSSKSRVSRLALVSSISQKMVGGKVKGRPLFKQYETPKKKEKQSSVAAKALTTTRNKKRLSNLGTFQSVRKPTALSVPKNRTVAKSLIFHSPNKTVRVNLKKSVELSTSMRKLCVGIKKLEITSGKKHVLGCNKSLPVDATRKQFRGRKVKSRVYDSLHPRNCQGKEAKPSKCLRKKNEEQELQQHCRPARSDGTENDFSDTEMEEKSRNVSLEVCSTSDISKINEGNQHEECLETQKTLEFPSDENKGEAITDASGNDSTSIIHDKETNAGNDDAEQQGKSRTEKQIKPNAIKTDENENVSVSDGKENENEVVNHDDKENASVSNDNRKLNPNTSHMEKKKFLGKQETSEGCQIVTKGTTKKTSKGNSTTAVNCAEGVNYRKPKLTNPKPFRLRTDERRILKEANLEKKLHLVEPLQQRTTKRIHQTAVLRNENCLERTECTSDVHEGSGKESNRRMQKDKPRRRGTCLQTSKAAAKRKESTTLQRNTVYVQQKTKLAASRQEFTQDKAANKSEESLKKTKSLRIKQVARTRGIERKTISLTTPGRLGVLKELSPKILRTQVVAKPMENVTSPATKASASSTPRPSLLGRKPTTIPKEPHLHDVHIPKSCTRRAV